MGSTLTLVTPAYLNPSGLTHVPIFARMSITFVPEPTSGLLLLLGVAALALARRPGGGA